MSKQFTPRTTLKNGWHVDVEEGIEDGSWDISVESPDGRSHASLACAQDQGTALNHDTLVDIAIPLSTIEAATRIEDDLYA